MEHLVAVGTAAGDQAFVFLIICKNMVYVKIHSYKTSYSYNNPKGTPALMQNSDPPQFCHYIWIFAYIGYLIQTIILNMINQHSQVYLFFTNIAFWDPNSAPICASRKCSGACVSARVMSDKQFVYADRALFDPKGLLRRAVDNTQICAR